MSVQGKILRLLADKRLLRATLTDARDIGAGDSLGLGSLDVVPHGDTAKAVSAVTASLSADPDAAVALTGGSALVVAVRAGLRAAGVSHIKTKPYWVPGRTGLD